MTSPLCAASRYPIRAVSYTHLDVYKRQLIAIRICIDFRYEEWCSHLARSFDLPLQKNGATAYKYYLAILQVQHSLPQRAEQVIDVYKRQV